MYLRQQRPSSGDKSSLIPFALHSSAEFILLPFKSEVLKAISASKRSIKSQLFGRRFDTEKQTTLDNGRHTLLAEEDFRRKANPRADVRSTPSRCVPIDVVFVAGCSKLRSPFRQAHHYPELITNSIAVSTK